MLVTREHVEDADAGDVPEHLEGVGESGREVILSVLKEGDFFGEMALLDNQPRSANVRAIEATRALVLSREVFHAALQEGPKLAIPVLAEMSRRLRRAAAPLARSCS